MFKRALRQRLLKQAERAIGLVDGVADEQAKISRHLIVSRPRGVQPPGGRADQFVSLALDIHMDIFERALEIERSLADF